MKLTAHIHAKFCEYAKDYDFSVWSHDMTSAGYVMLEKVEIDFTPPPRESMVQGTIEAYRAQQKAVRAEAERLHNELEQRINDLLCIEYKPEAA